MPKARTLKYKNCLIAFLLQNVYHIRVYTSSAVPCRTGVLTDVEQAVTNHPAAMQGLFVSIPEGTFRSDISSTQLRKELEASQKE